MNVNLKTPTETALSIYSTILEGKTPYVKTAVLEIEFSGTANDPAMEVSIVVDNKVMLTKSLSTDITKFECNWGKSVTTFNRQELLKGEDETSKILKVSNDYFTDKPIPIASIAGFYVRATKPGQYEIKAPDQLTSVKFSLAEADFRKVGLDPLYIPVANCPQWRLSNQLTSEFQSNSPDLMITQLSRFNGKD